MLDSAWLSLIWVLVCAILITGLAYWFTKMVGTRGGLMGFSASETKQFRTLARLALGKDQILVLVQAGERFFLLGVTPSAISTLAELTREEAEIWMLTQEEPVKQIGFREALQKIIQQKRQR